MTNKKSKKVTVRFSQQLKQAMEKQIIESGYGMHGKSKWVSDAITALATLSHLHELIEDGENINQGVLAAVEAFYLPQAVFKILRELMMHVRKHHPLLEGVQSAIIRTSVINKLIQ